MTIYMDVRFDVSKLTLDERSALALEVVVQAESSENHPHVPAPEVDWVVDDDVELDSEEFLRMVETSWYYETKGEIDISAEGGKPDQDLQDDPLRKLVIEMARYAKWHIDIDAAQQYDIDNGKEIDKVDHGQIAHRIARSLTILIWGSP